MFTLNEKAEKVIEIMQQRNLLQEYNFDITEELLLEYRKIYSEINNNRLELDIFFSRKFAALSLLEIKSRRGVKSNLMKEGFLYFIGNPAWSDKVKVGISTNYLKRLAGYQTYDPYRAYFIKGWEFVLSKREAEKLILNKYQLNTDLGEWISIESHIDMIQYIRSLIPILALEKSKPDRNGNLVSVGSIIEFKPFDGQKEFVVIEKFLANERFRGLNFEGKPRHLHLSEISLIRS